MKKISLIALLLLVTLSLAAKQEYPQSVQKASRAEPNISLGWNFEFALGAAFGNYWFKQSPHFTPGYDHHVRNDLGFDINAGIGVNYYFLPWMGIGTGAHFSTYANRAGIRMPWVLTTTDAYGDEYTITSTPRNLMEVQNIYMLELPIALKFRVRPQGIIGFTGTAGMKIGLPMYSKYQLKEGGTFENSIYYPKFDLTIHDVPSVVENLSIPGKQPPPASLRALNYAVYAEVGMLVRVHQRIEMVIAAYANYYVNDMLKTHGTADLGFGTDLSCGEYPMPYNADYNGILWTKEIESLHPWSVGLRVGVQFNAGRTNAQRAYIKQKQQEELLRMRTQDTTSVPTQPTPENRPTADTLATPTPPVFVASDTAVQAAMGTDTIVPDSVPQDSVMPSALYRVPATREEALAQIEQLAKAHHIDLCQDIIIRDTVRLSVREYIHDTVYISAPGSLQPATPVQTQLAIQTPEPVKIINPVAAQLDEVLKSSVIYFELDNADPILQPKDILERIAEVLRRHPNQQIHVNGHACKLGKPAYNKALALRRANAVADRLRALGVRDNQMFIASLGSNVPFRYNGQHQLSKDRRVEIVPIDPDAKKDQATTVTQTQQTQPTQPTQQAQPTRPTQQTQPGKAGQQSDPVRQTKPVFEVVQAGSSLAQMARQHYGVTDYWVFIYEANREKINNPNDMKIGTFLLIPDLSVRLKGLTKAQALDEAKRLKWQYGF